MIEALGTDVTGDDTHLVDIDLTDVGAHVEHDTARPTHEPVRVEVQRVGLPVR